MRVYYIIYIFVLFEITVQMPQNVNKTQETTVAVENKVEEVACLTVRNISGICVKRARCDYGPGVIDFTLYSPNWYKRPCKVDEACCPKKFLVEEKIQNDAVDSFAFDDDD